MLFVVVVVVKEKGHRGTREVKVIYDSWMTYEQRTQGYPAFHPVSAGQRMQTWLTFAARSRPGHAATVWGLRTVSERLRIMH
jgi:hypothetical protein